MARTIRIPPRDKRPQTIPNIAGKSLPLTIDPRQLVLSSDQNNSTTKQPKRKKTKRNSMGGDAKRMPRKLNSTVKSAVLTLTPCSNSVIVRPRPTKKEADKPNTILGSWSISTSPCCLHVEIMSVENIDRRRKLFTLKHFNKTLIDRVPIEISADHDTSEQKLHSGKLVSWAVMLCLSPFWLTYFHVKDRHNNVTLITRTSDWIYMRSYFNKTSAQTWYRAPNPLELISLIHLP